MRLLVLSSPDLVCFLPLTRGNLTKQPEWCEQFMPTTTSRAWFSIHEILPPPLLCLSPLLVLSTSSDSPSFLSSPFPDYLTARSYAYAYSYEIKIFWTFSNHIQLFQTLPCRKSLRKIQGSELWCIRRLHDLQYRSRDWSQQHPNNLIL